MADTGLVFYCIFCTILLLSLTTFLLRSYAHHSVPTHARIVVWISWNLCFSIVYILPLDLRPEVGNFEAMEPFYEFLYWFCFFLTWILTPFQSAFIKSGGFSTKERILDAIKLNVLFFVVVGVVLAVSFIYLLLATGMSTSSLGAVLQALGNLWGLSFAIMTMGYGLVEIPRYFWFRSTYKTRLDFLYFKCWELSECRDEARDRVDELLYLWKKAKLKQKSPLFAAEFAAIDAVIPRVELGKIEGQNRIQLPDITFESIDNAIDSGTDFGRQHMVQLHMAFKLWLFQLERSEAMLRKTVCDVADFEGRMERRNNNDYHRIPSGPNRWRRQLEVEGMGLLCRGGAVLFGAVSVAVIWSEVMMLTDYLGLSPYLSVFALLHDLWNMNLSIGFGALLFLYLASCSLFALWRIHINKDYHMHPLGLTDSASMLTNAAFSMRFMFPLGLNFLMLNISKHERDSNQYPYLSLFHAMSNLPVIGDPVNVLVPMLLILFAAATYFNLYAQILKKLRISRFEFSGASNEETRHFINEGQAISIKFRKNNESMDTSNALLRRYLAKHSISKSDDDERPVASLMEQSKGDDQRQLVNSKMEFIELDNSKADGPKCLGSNKSFGGFVYKYQVVSKTLGDTAAKFSVFVPPQASAANRVPILYFLSGLTCDETNFITKSGATQFAAKHGIALICPDTSPRGVDIKGDSDHWDFGKGAGFYVNATQKPWAPYYRMYEYVVVELPQILKSIDKFAAFDFDKTSIFGHSMGGHGALMIYLRNLSEYQSCSAFAPVTNPIHCRWGQKAFKNYIGGTEEDWKQYDSTELVKGLSGDQKMSMRPMLIDQGTDDFALSHGDDNHDQLRTKQFEAVCKAQGVPVDVRYQEGYGHGYDTIATFVGDHIAFHAQFLCKQKTGGPLKALRNVDRIIRGIDYQLKAPVKFETEGKPIQCKAAVAWHEWDEKSENPLTIETVTVAVPKKGEVRIKLICTGVCHTDWYTLSGKDPEGVFPAILGHEGLGVVESIGDGVKEVRVGDVVIPLYIPECRQCKFCVSMKTNLCQAVRKTQGRGLMPDESVRFQCVGGGSASSQSGQSAVAATDSKSGKPLFHFMGTSTFSQYTVCPEIGVAVVSPEVLREGVERETCLLGCGITTGLGAVRNTMRCEKGSTAAVFGMGGVGLSVIQGLVLNGASRILAVDINPVKFEMAKKLGATDCVNPLDPKWKGRPIQDIIVELTDGGVDYSFECIGLPQTMRAALECCHKGWGQSCIIGVAASGQTIQTRPFMLVTGRVWKGSAFGGTKGRSGVPVLVQEFLDGKINIKDMVTDVVPLKDINKAFWLMKQKEKVSIRTVVNLWE